MGIGNGCARSVSFCATLHSCRDAHNYGSASSYSLGFLSLDLPLEMTAAAIVSGYGQCRLNGTAWKNRRMVRSRDF